MDLRPEIEEALILRTPRNPVGIAARVRDGRTMPAGALGEFLRDDRTGNTGTMIAKFLDPEINLSPNPLLNGDGSVKHPAMDNHSMGTVFEELVRKFNEENNEEAGEHWTPRDAVKLMANLIFLPVAKVWTAFQQLRNFAAAGEVPARVLEQLAWCSKCEKYLSQARARAAAGSPLGGRK